MEQRTIAVGDVELAIAEAGSGGRPLLLVHGFTGAKEDFTDWLEPLAAGGWHAVAVDSRGHGGSSKPDELAAYTWDTLAGDVLGIATALWGEELFVLLGHSMGGAIAQEALLRAPERVRAVVLMDTTHGPLEIDSSDVALAVSIVEEHGIDALADALAARGSSPLDTPAHRRVLAERTGYAEYGDRKLRASAPAMYRAMLQAFFGHADRLDELRGVSVPALVIVGEQDRPFLGPSERMAKTIPGARLAVIPNAGHSPQFENPDAWWPALSSFLDEVA